MPHRSSLRRFLAAVAPTCLAALRQPFVQASFRWGWTNETIGGLWDRTGSRYLVFDIAGTREAARQRKLPTGQGLPETHRRLDALCAPEFTGHRRGEWSRTRTGVLQMHSRQGLGTFGGRGNGDYRAELRSAFQAVTTSLTEWQLAPGQGMVRVDGQYGDASVIADILATGVHVVVRKRGYQIFGQPQVQAALAHEPVATIVTRESPVTYQLFDLPQIALAADLPPVRLLITRRAWHGAASSVDKVIGEWVYEQYVTTLPCEGFLATNVLDLYQGRGAFEGTLADEDREGDPDRWCSLSPCGQDCWQVVWQWVWNLRLALAAGSTDDVLRSIEWAPEHAGTPRPSPSRFGSRRFPDLWTTGVGTSTRGTSGRDGLRAPGRWSAPMSPRRVALAFGNAPGNQAHPTADLRRLRCRLCGLSTANRVRRTDRQWQTRAAGECRATPADHHQPPVLDSSSSTRCHPLEGCGRTTVATTLDGSLASASSHDDGVTAGSGSHSSFRSRCPLASSAQLASTTRPQCARCSADRSHSGIRRRFPSVGPSRLNKHTEARDLLSMKKGWCLLVL